MSSKLIALAFVAVLSCAATAPKKTRVPVPPPGPPPAVVRVVMETSEGRIVLDLEREKAPVTAGNFLRYTDQKRLDGITFYRSVKPAANFGFIQFGIQNEPKRVLPPIAHEPTTQTGIKHVDGTISTARGAPGSARGDFTIMVGNQPSLDADPARPSDNLGYAAFGRVVEGMDVVHKILDAPIAEGGYFKGEMIAAPVKVISVKRLPMPPVPPVAVP